MAMVVLNVVIQRAQRYKDGGRQEQETQSQQERKVAQSHHRQKSLLRLLQASQPQDVGADTVAGGGNHSQQ